MQTIYRENGTTITKMTMKETGLRSPMEMMKLKIAKEKIAQADKELKAMGYNEKTNSFNK